MNEAQAFWHSFLHDLKDYCHVSSEQFIKPVIVTVHFYVHVAKPSLETSS